MRYIHIPTGNPVESGRDLDPAVFRRDMPEKAAAPKKRAKAKKARAKE